jgi:uncharacterized metal-binding protein
MSKKNFSCATCGVYACRSKDAKFPEDCLTANIDEDVLSEVLDLYRNDELISRIARASAEVEGQYYGKLTRVEEIIIFAKKIGAKRIGIANCAGLREEAKAFAKILQVKGLDYYSVTCKVGAVDKNEIGIPDELKIRKGGHESLCNPIMQAKILNAEKTDLNIIIGLCVGHDSLFIKYSDAPVTTLITKDRLLAHNPAGALYTSCSYYARLLTETF